MDMREISSLVRNNVGGYNENLLEILGDKLIFNYANNCVPEIVRELRRPVKEQDLVCTVGERGVQLPTDFLDWAGEHSARLIETADDSKAEGQIFPIVDDTLIV